MLPQGYYSTLGTRLYWSSFPGWWHSLGNCGIFFFFFLNFLPFCVKDNLVSTTHCISVSDTFLCRKASGHQKYLTPSLKPDWFKLLITANWTKWKRANNLLFIHTIQVILAQEATNFPRSYFAHASCLQICIERCLVSVHCLASYWKVQQKCKVQRRFLCCVAFFFSEDLDWNLRGWLLKVSFMDFLKCNVPQYNSWFFILILFGRFWFCVVVVFFFLQACI